MSKIRFVRDARTVEVYPRTMATKKTQQWKSKFLDATGGSLIRVWAFAK